MLLKDGTEQCFIEDGVCKIKIGNEYAICDEKYFEVVKQSRWCFKTGGYPVSFKELHKILCPSYKIVHHKNGNPLDNRLENLVGCDTHKEHMAYHRELNKIKKQEYYRNFFAKMKEELNFEESEAK